jgi:hypothetical protein
MKVGDDETLKFSMTGGILTGDPEDKDTMPTANMAWAT